MNLAKLFETQKVLRDRIGYEGSDRFEKLILALQVEVGECANEWRGFKFWSKNQEPRTEADVECYACNGTGDLNYEFVQEDAEGYGGHEYIDCPDCDCSGYSGTKNPLLEEYVDGLHFVLELGLEHGIDELINVLALEIINCSTITQQFSMLMRTDWDIYEEGHGGYYHEGLELYIGLGEMLGFTWKQIEQAYYDKNQVNHERQSNGY